MIIRSVLTVAIIAGLALASPALAQPARTAQPTRTEPTLPEAEATYQAIKKMFGFVPSFMKAYPEVGIAAAWDQLVALEMNPNTALAAKTKALVGIAVAAQIPCRYCIYMDTQTAKLNGATDTEIKEAIAMSAITRHWSTVLNGLQIDENQFKKELTRVLAHVANPPKAAEVAPPVVVINDAKSAYKDIQLTLGMVPSFLRAYPAIAIAPAWREMKSLQLNPITALPPKIKELIGLAVAAQIPCTYCIRFHTEAARLNGATDNEIKESVAIAALTRQWSTVLNGSMLDEPTFRKEVDQMMREVKKSNQRAAR